MHFRQPRFAPRAHRLAAGPSGPGAARFIICALKILYGAQIRAGGPRAGLCCLSGQVDLTETSVWGGCVCVSSSVLVCVVCVFDVCDETAESTYVWFGEPGGKREAEEEQRERGCAHLSSPPPRHPRWRAAAPPPDDAAASAHACCAPTHLLFLSGKSKQPQSHQSVAYNFSSGAGLAIRCRKWLWHRSGAERRVGWAAAAPALAPPATEGGPALFGYKKPPRWGMTIIPLVLQTLLLISSILLIRLVSRQDPHIGRFDHSFSRPLGKQQRGARDPAQAAILQRHHAPKTGRETLLSPSHCRALSDGPGCSSARQRRRAPAG